MLKEKNQRCFSIIKLNKIGVSDRINSQTATKITYLEANKEQTRYRIT